MLKIVFLLLISSAFANEANTPDISSLNKMLSFAKESLIENTQKAEAEFGIEKPSDAERQKSITIEEQYSTPENRDIFFSSKHSALINQAYDYFKQGKRMNIKEAVLKTEQIEQIIQPLIRVSSLMFNNAENWAVFTNVGRFTYKKPFVDGIKITGISSSQVEFVIPINKTTANVISTIKEDLKHRNRIFVEGRSLIVQLRTGECIFENELQITTRCKPIVKKIEKQVAI